MKAGKAVSSVAHSIRSPRLLAKHERRNAHNIAACSTKAPAFDSDIIDAFILELEMDFYIDALELLDESLDHFSQTRMWKMFVADCERLELSAEELRRLSDE